MRREGSEATTTPADPDRRPDGLGLDLLTVDATGDLRLLVDVAGDIGGVQSAELHRGRVEIVATDAQAALPRIVELATLCGVTIHGLLIDDGWARRRGRGLVAARGGRTTHAHARG